MSTPGARPVVVAGVDGSDASIDALAWAFTQAQLTGAELEVVTAWQWPLTLGTPLPLVSGYDPAADAERVLDGIVGPMAARFPTVPVRTRPVKGHPAEVLVEASRHADLLVVGSRGHGTLSGALLGSVSQHCVAHAAAPVLVHHG